MASGSREMSQVLSCYVEGLEMNKGIFLGLRLTTTELTTFHDMGNNFLNLMNKKYQ